MPELIPRKVTVAVTFDDGSTTTWTVQGERMEVDLKLDMETQDVSIRATPLGARFENPGTGMAVELALTCRRPLGDTVAYPITVSQGA